MDRYTSEAVIRALKCRYLVCASLVTQHYYQDNQVLMPLAPRRYLATCLRHPTAGRPMGHSVHAWEHAFFFCGKGWRCMDPLVLRRILNYAHIHQDQSSYCLPSSVRNARALMALGGNNTQATGQGTPCDWVHIYP